MMGTYMFWGVIAYLVLINIITFIVFGVDKYKARNHKWRVPEATLFLLAIIGGSIGAILGMYTFRHHTGCVTVESRVGLRGQGCPRYEVILHED